MVILIIVLSLINIFECKSVLFPFKKLTIEYLNKTKTISDFIEYNIYTNISMGTPIQKVSFFILKSDKVFSIGEMKLSKENYYIQKEIENVLDIFYAPMNSTSLEELDPYNWKFADIFYFKDLNDKVETRKLNFTMISRSRLKQSGTLDLYSRDRYDREDVNNIYVFSVLKANKLIDNYYITFIYDEYDYENNSTYFNDDYNNIFGKLIIGDSPHLFAPEKYKEKDEIKINGEFNLKINEIKFKNNKSNYTEKDINVPIKFTSAFIKGTFEYKNEIDNIFFSDLINKNICRIHYLKDNVDILENIIYSCDNSEIMKKEIKYLPTIYFEIKEYNLTFLFNYKELFKLHNNRLYFLIYFQNNTNQIWEFGELFLRKYITSFNYDSKTISFYKTQLDEINKKTDIPYSDKDSDSNKKSEYNKERSEIIRIVVEIVVGVVLIATIIIITIFFIKQKKQRKKRAEELNDEYDYIPKDDNKLIN